MSSVGYLDLTNLASDLSKASGDTFKQAAQSLVTDSANQVQTFAKAFAPVRTGSLKESIVVEISNGGMGATITAASDHASFVEFGTGTRGEFPGQPIIIRAKPGKMLSWVGSDGKRRFAKQVVNPGMAPRPFMRPALERVGLPLASSLGDRAVMFILHGPNAPETLQGAPVQGDASTNHTGYTLGDRAKIIGAVSKTSAATSFHVVNAKKTFI